MFIFSASLTTSRIGNLTRLIHTLLVMTTYIHTFFIYLLNLTYSRLTSSLPSCLWSLRIFPSLPDSRLTIFYRAASSAILQLVNQWLDFIYSRPHAVRYGRKNPNPTLVRIELTPSALPLMKVCRLPNHYRPLGRRLLTGFFPISAMASIYLYRRT